MINGSFQECVERLFTEVLKQDMAKAGKPRKQKRKKKEKKKK